MHFANANAIKNLTNRSFSPGGSGYDLVNQVKRIICQNDAETLKNLLNGLKSSERDVLKTWQTQDESSNLCCHKYTEKILQKPCPLIFEATSKDKFTCVKVLVEQGFKLHVLDKNGWNILHYLIAISFYDAQYEEKAEEIWCKLVVLLAEQNLVGRILMQEDLDGLRPVEMALHTGCIGLFDKIINTPGVYQKTKTKTGLWENITYDITEYEECLCAKNRRGESLPLLACHLDSKVLTNKKHTSILLDGIVLKWTKAKLIINIFPVLLWFLLRFFICLAFYIVVSSDLPSYGEFVILSQEIGELFGRENFTTVENFLNDTVANNSQEDRERLVEVLEHLASYCPPIDWYNAIAQARFFWTSFAFLCGFAPLSIIFDVLEIIIAFTRKWFKWWFVFGTRKDLVTSSTYYRLCQFLFSFCMIIWLGAYISAPESNLAEYSIIPTCYVSVWTVLYFVQMMPSVGHFVTSIQKMLTIMLQFLIVYFFILIPYPHGFSVLLSHHVNSTCTLHGFETVGEAWYSTFKIMLNMVDLGQYYDSNGLQAANILHIIYVFTVAILLVNFLIALLSSAVGQTVDAANVVLLLQRLSVVTTVERRLIFFCPFYYKLMQRLVYTCEDGKIYLNHSRFVGIDSDDEET